MRLSTLTSVLLLVAPLAATTTIGGCDQKQPEGGSATSPHGNNRVSTPAGDHNDSHAPGHGGAVISLGEKTVGSFTATATRDEGQIVAGKDAPIDVTITPAAGATVKVAAVRFWIGTQDAKGSVKAKAEVEDPKDPNRWHVHAEIPNPMPANSQLWVEIEDDKGGTSVGNFDLKQ